MTAREDKDRLRKVVLGRLGAITTAHAAGLSARIVECVQASSPWRGSDAVMLFLPLDRPGRLFADEPDVSPLIAAALQQNKQVLLPRLEPDRAALTPIKVFDPDFPREVRKWGVVEPIGPPADLHGTQGLLIVVPGVAFDLHGGRLGRGAGYYDRFFASWEPARQRIDRVGVCFDVQLVERVPTEPHDALVHAVVTESGFHPAMPEGSRGGG